MCCVSHAGYSQLRAPCRAAPRHATPLFHLRGLLPVTPLPAAEWPAALLAPLHSRSAWVAEAGRQPAVCADPWLPAFMHVALGGEQLENIMYKGEQGVLQRS